MAVPIRDAEDVVLPHFGIDFDDTAVVSSAMDLSAWMTKEGLTDAALAARLKVGGNTVNRWRNRRRRPRATEMAMLHELSDGAVTANDFYHHGKSTVRPSPTPAEAGA